MKFFKYIYYNVYLASAKFNASPEIPVISYISFAQTNNIISLMYIFLFFTKLVRKFNLPVIYLIIQIILFIVNYYYFIVFKKGDVIVKNEKYSLGKFSFMTEVYLFLSVLLTGLTGYLFQEF